MFRIPLYLKDRPPKVQKKRPALDPARQELLAVRHELGFLDVLDMSDEAVIGLLSAYYRQEEDSQIADD